MENENDEQQPKRMIPLDGSHGAGVNAQLTIITKNPETGSKREETFTVPAALVHHENLLFFYKTNLILGFALLKEEPIDQLKELGL